MLTDTLKKSPLGKTLPYLTEYDPSRLFPIARSETRKKLSLSTPLPFDGIDLWNAYELSWLDPKGKPHVTIAQFILPCSSPYIIESKSLKMYLHSFNQSMFDSADQVFRLIKKDLSEASGSEVGVKFWFPHEFHKLSSGNFTGKCLDDLDIQTDCYDIDPSILKVGKTSVEETVYSNLLKSNCLVTQQPDWGHVAITYKGRQIDHASLLKYIISYRNHNGFHEQCIEQMFVEIQQYCHPEKLTVYGRYTRRGGLDISPFRSNFETLPTGSWRLHRQ